MNGTSSSRQIRSPVSSMSTVEELGAGGPNNRSNHTASPISSLTRSTQSPSRQPPAATPRASQVNRETSPEWSSTLTQSEEQRISEIRSLIEGIETGIRYVNPQPLYPNPIIPVRAVVSFMMVADGSENRHIGIDTRHTANFLRSWEANRRLCFVGLVCYLVLLIVFALILVLRIS